MTKGHEACRALMWFVRAKKITCNCHNNEWNVANTYEPANAFEA